MRNRTSAARVLLIASWLAVSVPALGGGQHPSTCPPIPPEFAGYPTSDAFRLQLRPHLDPNNAAFVSRPALLAVTWFPHGTETPARVIQVGRKGDVVAASVSLPAGGVQGMQSRQLSSEGIARLRRAIDALPWGDTWPDLRDLVIVSYNRHGVWHTDRYDRKDQPNGLLDIYAILGMQSAAHYRPIPASGAP